MILIVDSGATKSDWIALNENGEQLFLTQTLGLSFLKIEIRYLTFTSMVQVVEPIV